MFDGKQVVRVENNYKKSDLYNIGVEMSERKGTGNYDKERTSFNVEYVSLNERNLYQEVKQILKSRNIDYSNKPSTNLVNGITFTSGIEFFEKLGLKLKNTDRVYQSGDKIGQIIKIPDIKSKNDIPKAVSYYFDSCMDFLKKYVGEENIILAQIHYDEDTPHLQAYFLPITHEVNRKCYEKDSNGNIVKEEYINKNGEKSYKFKLLRDKEGKIVYKTEKGIFLNNDQFWKNKGGKTSFAKLQDEFNKFINDRGFNLDRGEIGANKNHTTKLEYEVNELKAEIKDLTKEKDYIQNEIKNSKESLKKSNKVINKDILNPKKSIIGYNPKDINEIIEYSKKLEQINVFQEQEIISKDNTITKLTTENNSYKNNKEIKKRDKLINEQRSTIIEQKEEISRLSSIVKILENKIEDLKSKFDNEIEKWKDRFSKLAKAIDKVLGKESYNHIEDYDKLANAINYGYYRKNNNKNKHEIEL